MKNIVIKKIVIKKIVIKNIVIKKIVLALIVCLSMSAQAMAHSKPITPANAKKFKAECEAGNGNSCQAMGGILRSKKDAKKAKLKVNYKLALQYYARGCSLGDIGACQGANYIYADKNFSGYNPAKALDFFIKKCAKKGKGSSGCRVLKRLKKDL